MKIRRSVTLLAILSVCLILCFVLSSCKKDDVPIETEPDTEEVAANTQITFFNGSEYVAKLVYDEISVTDMTLINDKLVGAFKTAFDSAPTVIKSSDETADPSVVELLVGTTDRAESLPLTDLAENDAWYYVGAVGNKIVINGSNEYMLGLAVDEFIEKYLSGEDSELVVAIEDEIKVIWADYASADWKLYALPYYKGARAAMSMARYDSGKMLTNLSDKNAESAKMQVVSRTTRSEFNSYIERLKEVGYEIAQNETLENNVYTTLTNGTYKVHVYYTSQKGTVNVIIDKDTALPSEVSIPLSGTSTATPTFYLYGLDHDYGIVEGTGVKGAPTTGLLLVAKCGDGSVIIVDGGATVQMQGDAGKQFNDFLHTITNTPEGGKVTISCWYLTHLHGDHYHGFKEFIKQYSSLYDLKSICTNINFNFTDAYNDIEFSRQLNKSYPNCKEIKIHTGQKLEFGGVSMQALFTHEDRVNVTTGKSDISTVSLNHSSLVMKVWVDGMSMLVLGDALHTSEESILAAFTEETLKCDIVQVAHHAYDGVSKTLYDVVDADICLVPNSYGRYMERYLVDTSLLEVYPDLKPVLERSEVYFAGKFEYTVGFAVVNNQISVVYQPELIPEYSEPELKLEIGKDSETNWNELEKPS